SRGVSPAAEALRDGMVALGARGPLAAGAAAGRHASGRRERRCRQRTARAPSGPRTALCAGQRDGGHIRRRPGRRPEGGRAAQRLAGRPLPEKLQALTALYDPQGTNGGTAYAHVENGAGGLRLVEQNCPFLNVATERPAVCSVSVSLLSQLLGVEVVREERFQDGDGRCVFRVYEDRPIPEDQRGWKPEPAKSSS